MDKYFNRRLPDVIISSFFLVIFLLVCSVPKGEGQLRPPPSLQVDRNWRVPEDEPIGTRVKHAHAQDIENRELDFSILPSDHNDVSSYFRIDAKTGAVFLSQSLKGKRGTQGYLYISVRTVSSDEETQSIPARIEVRVQIDPPISESNSNSGQQQQGHGNQNSRPPFIHSIVPPILFPPPGAVIPPVPPMDHMTKIPVPQLPPPSPTTTSSSSSASGEVVVVNKNDITRDESEGLNLNGTTIVPLKPVHDRGNGSKTATTTSATSSGSGKPSTTKNTQQHGGGEPTGKDTDLTSNDNGSGVDSEEPGDNSISGNEGDNSQSEATKKDKAEDNSHTVALVTVIPIVLLFGIVPIVLATLWLLRKRNKVKKRPTKEIRKESAATTASNVTMSGEGDSPSALTHWAGTRAQSNRYESWDPDSSPTQVQNRWDFPRHHLQISGILGEGCFGQVWRAEALNIDSKEGTTTVAIKTLKESAGERERADLLSELTVMKMLDPHPNVVRLLGSCTEKDPIFLIMEYVDMGKLQSYLRDSRAHHYYGNLHADSSSLSSKDLTSFAHQVARGMEYLASKGIIHRDLAARNILIDKDRVCKVADFGFARDVIANHVYERKSDGRLPIRWMAPEALYDNIFVVTKSDVWSFGVLMWEIVTLGSTPYPGMAAGEVMRKVRDGYRLEKPEHCRRELYNIMFYCWAHNPDDRPTFPELVNFLRHLLFSETDYIELDRFPDHDYYNMPSLSGEKL